MSKLVIIRSETRINRATTDSRLTLAARFVAGFLQSRTDEWRDVSIQRIATILQVHHGVIERSIAQLKKCGYLDIAEQRSERGKFSTTTWTYYEEPKPQNRVTDKHAETLEQGDGANDLQQSTLAETLKQGDGHKTPKPYKPVTENRVALNKLKEKKAPEKKANVSGGNTALVETTNAATPQPALPPVIQSKEVLNLPEKKSGLSQSASNGKALKVIPGNSNHSLQAGKPLPAIIPSDCAERFRQRFNSLYAGKELEDLLTERWKNFYERYRNSKLIDPYLTWLKNIDDEFHYYTKKRQDENKNSVNNMRQGSVKDVADFSNGFGLEKLLAERWK